MTPHSYRDNGWFTSEHHKYFFGKRRYSAVICWELIPSPWPLFISALQTLQDEAKLWKFKAALWTCSRCVSQKLIIRWSKNLIRLGLKMVHTRLYICFTETFRTRIFPIWVRSPIALWPDRNRRFVNPTQPVVHPGGCCRIRTLQTSWNANSLRILLQKELTLNFWNTFMTLNSLDRFYPLLLFLRGGSRYPVHYVVALHHSAIGFSFTRFDYLTFMTGVVELEAVLKGRNPEIHFKN